MIKVNNLVKKFGGIEAISNINFEVNSGDILGFLGPNGAGKSTTMKILAGFLQPTSGTAEIDGKDILTESMEAREKIGYLPESTPLYKETTVKELLNFVCDVRGLINKKSKIDEIISLTHLEQVAYQTIDTLSKGYRQRVGFAQALIHNPPVLIMDEPTDGLDPNQKYEVRNLIKNLSTDKAIILSTHILEEMEAICNRIIIINRGEIIENTTPKKLLQLSDKENRISVQFTAQFTPELVQDIKGNNSAIIDIKIIDNHEMEILSNQNIVCWICNFFNKKGISFSSFNYNQGKTDEIFRKLTNPKNI